MCLALVHSGHTVRVTVCANSVTSELSSEVEIANCDIQDAPALIKACEGCDVVIHTAALMGSWLPDTAIYDEHDDMILYKRYSPGDVCIYLFLFFFFWLDLTNYLLGYFDTSLFGVFSAIILILFVGSIPVYITMVQISVDL